jgi:exodeoxyribonuclease III
MRILSWNIKWGGQTRVPAIAAALRLHAPDIIALTEYMPRVSAPLVEALNASGYEYHALSSPPPRCGGVAILSRLPLELRPPTAPLEPFASRFVHCTIPTANVSVVGLYGLLQKEPYDAFWHAVLDELAANASVPLVVIGDFNTGESLVDTCVDNFFCSNFFAQLPTRGYTDLWRHSAGRDAREFTWQGPVNPYRLDHAFGTNATVERMISCSYSHAERLAGISDHSLMTVELEPAVM